MKERFTQLVNARRVATPYLLQNHALRPLAPELIKGVQKRCMLRSPLVPKLHMCQNIIVFDRVLLNQKSTCVIQKKWIRSLSTPDEQTQNNMQKD